jgi:phosphoribosylformylglycinamidine synthase
VSAYHADIFVTLRPVVNDPQGLAIQGGLKSLGFGEVTSVRAGKYIEVRLDASDEATARKRVEAMCSQLLANPVIEDYRFDVRPA